ncbi:NF038122 family metalloprotease [Phenylobacterium sp.]|uniref:NF038122 family metalloprotease n=1 Tax=Phenylobacterium sp. TaxID=1871053 RepID=UPI0025FC8500|nr:NF038122 family metalloprotease [Phenylobacterium sp.]MBX3484197.1 NF038122 family metalloprotease [Phenylobacterium sp.]
MLKSKLKTTLLVGSAAAAMAASTPASALEIVLHDIGGVTGSRAEQGFVIAAKYWESVLTNNAVVHINVGYSDLGPNVLGSTGSSLLTFVPIADYYDALAFTGTSALDALAVANLSPVSGSGSVNVLVPNYSDAGAQTGAVTGESRVAPDGLEISSTIALTSANAKAFGVDFGPDFIDAEIQFSSQFAFDFNPLNGIAAGRYDFIGVAIHEIGHALGFVSSADDFDFIAAIGYDGPVDDFWWGYGLDLFRYTSAGQLDWQADVPAYFSIDGGQTALMDGYFSTGSFTGDGNQASHWKEPNQATPCLNFRGIMNPYICGGTGDAVTGLDLALFDAIGWNLNVDVLNGNYHFTTAQAYQAFGVPEPSTWAVTILGFGLLGAAMRRRRAALAL